MFGICHPPVGVTVSIFITIITLSYLTLDIYSMIVKKKMASAEAGKMLQSYLDYSLCVLSGFSIDKVGMFVAMIYDFNIGLGKSCSSTLV